MVGLVSAADPRVGGWRPARRVGCRAESATGPGGRHHL